MTEAYSTICWVKMIQTCQPWLVDCRTQPWRVLGTKGSTCQKCTLPLGKWSTFMVSFLVFYIDVSVQQGKHHTSREFLSYFGIYGLKIEPSKFGVSMIKLGHLNMDDSVKKNCVLSWLLGSPWTIHWWLTGDEASLEMAVEYLGDVHRRSPSLYMAMYRRFPVILSLDCRHELFTMGCRICLNIWTNSGKTPFHSLVHHLQTSSSLVQSP